MEWISKEVVSIIYYLMPGFLAAWVFYTLTAHRKTSPFERVVEALIFTVIVQAVTAVVRWIFLLIGHVIPLGPWTQDSALIWSIILALLVGSLVAWSANTDYLHRWLRELHVTKRTSFPSQWYSAFNSQSRWVTLHLKGGRRLYGWPEEWPDHSDSGHFILDQPEWLLDDGRRAPLHNVERILVAATDVELVEFLKYEDELPDRTEAERVRAVLEELHRKEQDNHGS